MPFCLQCGHATENKIPEGDSKIRQVCPNCNYIHYENPKVITGAIVTYSPTHDEKTAKVLLCRRAIEPRYGFWTLPAGFMELDETTEQGALRETWEEAEATAVATHLYVVYDTPDIGQVYTMYRATLKEGAYGVGQESLECALFDEADIPWHELAFPIVYHTLKYYFEDRKTGEYAVRHKVIHKKDLFL